MPLGWHHVQMWINLKAECRLNNIGESEWVVPSLPLPPWTFTWKCDVEAINIRIAFNLEVSSREGMWPWSQVHLHACSKSHAELWVTGLSVWTRWSHREDWLLTDRVQNKCRKAANAWVCNACNATMMHCIVVVTTGSGSVRWPAGHHHVCPGNWLGPGPGLRLVII